RDQSTIVECLNLITIPPRSNLRTLVATFLQNPRNILMRRFDWVLRCYSYRERLIEAAHLYCGVIQEVWPEAVSEFIAHIPTQKSRGQRAVNVMRILQARPTLTLEELTTAAEAI